MIYAAEGCLESNMMQLWYLLIVMLVNGRHDSRTRGNSNEVSLPRDRENEGNTLMVRGKSKGEMGLQNG